MCSKERIFFYSLGFVPFSSDFGCYHSPPSENDIISKQCVSNYPPNETPTSEVSNEKCGNNMTILSSSWHHNTDQYQTFFQGSQPG